MPSPQLFSTRTTLGYPVSRPFVLSVAKLIILGISNVPLIDAAPLQLSSYLSTSNDGGKSAEDPSLWLYLGTAVFLVLLGGVFAGLTIA
jgi:metal transporter CNNM